jgi:hypothetical protein
MTFAPFSIAALNTSAKNGQSLLEASSAKFHVVAQDLV